MKKIFIFIFVISALLVAEVSISEPTKRTINDADYSLNNEKHKASKMTCVDCHGNGEREKYKAIMYDSCLSCHGPAEKLAKKTAYLGEFDNIHDSAHWGLELACSTCHAEHNTARKRNLCVQCHQQDSMTRLKVK